MKPIISQKLINVLKNKIFNVARDIAKSIVISTFEDIKDISKNRRQLVNRSVFSCCTSKA